MGRNHYTLKNDWPIHFAALIFFTLFSVLGVWQINRGLFKSELQSAADPERQQEIERLVLPLENPGDWRYRTVRVAGHYHADKYFLLDNQVRDHQPGYNVLSPFYANIFNAWVLVDRGWIPQGTHRDELPDVVVGPELSMILAEVYVPYQKAFSLGGIAEGEDEGWPRRIQFVDYSELSKRFGKELQPFTLRLHPSNDNGFRRDWISIQLPAKKHYAYAFQWFALAAAIVTLWLVYFIWPAMKRNGK